MCTGWVRVATRACVRGEPRNCELRISICEVATRACVRGETKRGTIVLPRLGSHTRARANGRSSDNVKATKGGNDVASYIDIRTTHQQSWKQSTGSLRPDRAEERARGDRTDLEAMVR